LTETDFSDLKIGDKFFAYDNGVIVEDEEGNSLFEVVSQSITDQLLDSIEVKAC
jgi:hypothetical protein